jgi:hypothetical protein
MCPYGVWLCLVKRRIFVDYLNPSRQMICLKIGHDGFLLHIFQFGFHYNTNIRCNAA